MCADGEARRTVYLLTGSLRLPQDPATNDSEKFKKVKKLRLLAVTNTNRLRTAPDYGAPLRGGL